MESGDLHCRKTANGEIFAGLNFQGIHGFELTAKVSCEFLAIGK